MYVQICILYIYMYYIHTLRNEDIDINNMCVTTSGQDSDFSTYTLINQQKREG